MNIIKAITHIYILFHFSSFPLNAQSTEYAVKASYIGKFAEFTKWPGGFAVDSFTICVIGEDPFDGALERLAGKYRLHKHPIAIKKVSDVVGLERCNILFIPSSEKEKLNEIVDAVRSEPILIIGDSKNYIESGVHLNFYLTKKQTIHFEVNPDAIKESGLKVDAMLLNYGRKLDTH